jgi:hypothetical protein
MVISFIGGGNRSTLRKPPTRHKSLTKLSYNVISSTPHLIFIIETIFSGLKDAEQQCKIFFFIYRYLVSDLNFFFNGYGYF